jgi:hypothetical protein
MLKRGPETILTRVIESTVGQTRQQTNVPASRSHRTNAAFLTNMRKADSQFLMTV